MAGVGTFIRLILRRDRVKLPVWLLVTVLSLVAMVPLLKETYGDSATLHTLYQTFALNPAGLFLTGPMDAPSFGALMTIETTLWWGLLIAFMNTLFVVRHTRQNEETGAQELLLSGRAHRASGLVAALVVAFGVDVLLALGIGAGLHMVGAPELWSVESAWLHGITLGLFGFVWAAIAALVVQLVESARSANGLLAGLIGTAFVVRGIGDFMGSTSANGLHEPTVVSWLSPFGWLQAARSLTAPEWWPLLVSLGFVAVAVPLAFWLLGARDVGAGLLPARIGRARAKQWLATPLGLTWKLQKNIFIGWCAGVVAMAVIVGMLVPEMSRVFESSESAKAMIMTMGGNGALIPTFLSAMLMITVLMVVAYTVQGITRLRAEESSGRAENLLATRLSRFKWLGLHAAVVLAGGAVMLALCGFVLGSLVAVTSDISVNVVEYTLAGLSYFPVLALFVGLYVLFFGLLPRAAGLVVWAYFGLVVFMSWIAPLLQLDQWMMNLSPLAHVASAPSEAIRLEPLLVLGALSLVSVATGTVAWRNRNLQS